MSYTTLLLSCLLVVFTLTSCGGNATVDTKIPTAEASVEEVDTRKEEKAIINLINQETAAFVAKDVDKLLDCYISDGRFSRIQQLSQGRGMVKEGGKPEDLRESMMAYFTSMGDWVFELNKRVGMKISFSEDNTVATVTFTQVANGSSEKSEEVRIVEKEDGEWKILLISSVMH